MGRDFTLSNKWTHWREGNGYITRLTNSTTVF